MNDEQFTIDAILDPLFEKRKGFIDLITHDKLETIVFVLRLLIIVYSVGYLFTLFE